MFRGRGAGVRGGFAATTQNNSEDRPAARGGFQGGRGSFGATNQNSNNDGFSGRGGGFGARGGGFGSNNQNDSEERSSGRGGFQAGFGGRGGGFGATNQNSNDDGFSGRGGFQGGSGGRGAFGSSNQFGGDNRSSARGNFQDGFGGRGGFGSNNQTNGDSRPPRACFKCGETGHLSFECPAGGGPSMRETNGPYGRRFNDDNGFEDRPIRPSFVPKIREVDEIFQDDEVQDNVAEDLYQQDMQVVVEGAGENLRVIDTWASAGFSKEILDNIQRSRFVQPRNFQKYCIPLVLDGLDVKGQAETGSGKSAAFLLPIIHALQQSFEENKDASRRLKVSALIIEPTRELAKQLFEQASKFAHNTGVTCNFAYGEYNMGVNKQSLMSKGCDILIGTAGRLKHLFTDLFVKPEALQFLVLDEADRLLDYNFMDDIEGITRVQGFPKAEDRQTLFFSATMSAEIVRLANQFCKGSSVLVKNTSSGVNSRISQQIVHVPADDRKEYLLKMLKQEMAENNGVLAKKLIFVETKRDADNVATLLTDEGIKAQTVNGDRPQALREEATAGFRSGDFRALVVTNVFARGLDIKDLGQVINYQLPSDRDTYVHRIGRTGRLNTGVATSFFDPEHQPDRDFAGVLIEELKNAGQEVPDFVKAATDPFASYSKPAARGFDSQPSGNWGGEQPKIAEPEF